MVQEGGAYTSAGTGRACPPLRLLIDAAAPALALSLSLVLSGLSHSRVCRSRVQAARVGSPAMHVYAEVLLAVLLAAAAATGESAQFWGEGRM